MRQTLLAALIFTASTLALTYPQIVHMAGLPIHVDSYFSVWRLAWIAHQLRHDPLHLFDANIFYPERGTLAYSDAILAPGVLAAPLFWLGVAPVVVYNLVLLSAFVLSGTAMFVLMRHLIGDVVCSLFAGLVFSAAPFRFEHYGHLELQMSFWMPLGLWALHRTVRSSRVADALLVAGAMVLQVLSSIYYGVYFAAYQSLVGALLLFTTRGRPRGRPAVLLLMAALLASMLLFPYLQPYRAARETVGQRSTDEIHRYSATYSNYLAAPKDSLLYGWTSDQFGGNERNLFPGLVVILLAAVALAPPFSRVHLIYGAGLLFAVEMSLGLNGSVYRHLYDLVEPVRGLRVPARSSMLVVLSLAILSGFGLARLRSFVPTRRARIGLTAIVIGASALEFRSTIDLIPVTPAPSSAQHWFQKQPLSVLINVPVARPERLDTNPDAAYMYDSIGHWQPLVNGYSGFYPVSYIELLERMRSFPDDRSLSYLRRRHVDYIVVRSRFFNARDLARVMARLLSRTDVALIYRYPEPGGESIVFRIPR